MRLKNIKRFYTPLYKFFIALKKNVQNRDKLIFQKFHKKKWKPLINTIRREHARRKSIFRAFDLSRYHLFKFSNSFQRQYKKNLHAKKRLKLFYGKMRNKIFKNYIEVALKQRRNSLKKNLSFFLLFLTQFEHRLDNVLYKSHFVLSVSQARQLISHKCVQINKIVVIDKSYRLKKGDVLEITPKGKQLVEENISKSYFWPIPPKYLFVNYKTLQIIYVEDMQFENFATLYHYRLEIQSAIQQYQ